MTKILKRFKRDALSRTIGLVYSKMRVDVYGSMLYRIQESFLSMRKNIALLMSALFVSDGHLAFADHDVPESI